MTRSEAAAVEKDAAAQERAVVAPPRQPVIAPGFVRAVHPDHGQVVVYTPGEALPEWVADLLAAHPDRIDGVVDVIDLTT